MYLEFEFIVPEGASGRLQTTDATNSDYPLAPRGIPLSFRNPVYLSNNSRIVDFTRRDDAFIPGTAGIEWSNGNNSLQGTASTPRRSISLDGIPPIITQFSPGGKSVYPNGENFMYFRDGEILTFTLLAQEPIFVSGNNPRIGFQITDGRGFTSGIFYANYARPSGPYGMVFEINVSGINLTNVSQSGELLVTSLYLNTDLGNIVDHVQNVLIAGNLQQRYLDSARGVRFDKKTPEPAIILLTAPNVMNNNPHEPIARYSVNPIIAPIPNYEGPTELWGVDSQFSLTGFTWVNTVINEAYLNSLVYNSPERRALNDWIVGFSEWTTGNPIPPLQIKSNQWALQTRRRDRAGNVSPPTIYNINIRSTFPRLIAIGARNADAIYTQGPITFTLDFDDRVVPTITNLSSPNRAFIIVADRSQPAAGLSDVNGEGELLEFVDRVYVDLVYECDNSACLTTCIVSGHLNRRLRPSNTLTFTWFPEGKQMGNGLVVTQINLNGDIECMYGNKGIDSVRIPAVIAHAATPPDTFGSERGRITMNDPSRNPSAYDVFNLNGAGLRIYTIPPELRASMPPRAGVMAMNARDTITLIFNTDMRTESGTIIVKPRYTRTGANYDWPIPPVLPAESHVAEDGSWNPGLPEVFNAINTNARDENGVLLTTARVNTLRSYLITPATTGGNGFLNPQLSARTGLPNGPYRLTTQGLTEGFGYTGTNSAGTTQAGTNTAGWSVDTSQVYMVPDITDKYVLAYARDIKSTTDDAVQNIRTALRAARYRWQEIDVIAGVRVVAATQAELIAIGDTSPYNSANTRKVIIELEYPLPIGMRWEIDWSSEALTSIAGLPAVPEDDWWFWTDGVQKPVIRVDRRSADYRTYPNLAIFDSINNQHPIPPVGYRTEDFNTVNFKVESETPDASVHFTTLRGVQSGATTGQYNNGAVTMSWTGANWATGFGMAPPSGNLANEGLWVLPNLVRRRATGRWTSNTAQNGVRYTVREAFIYDVERPENTSPIIRYIPNEVVYQGQGNLRMIRSYNKDATWAELNAITFAVNHTNPASNIVFSTSPTETDLTASKNYIIAEARSSHTAVVSKKGYEGIFRTVVAFHTPNEEGGDAFGFNLQGARPMTINGSNLQSASPSIAGFPLMLLDSDLRYLKIPQRVIANTRFLWISTEIVSPWFIRISGIPNSSSLMSRRTSLFGDIGSMLTGGYGDLTYSLHQDTKTFLEN
jgi:hypothetical protein